MAQKSDVEKIVKRDAGSSEREIRETVQIVKELKDSGLVRSGYGLVSPYDDRRLHRKTPPRNARGNS